MIRNLETMVLVGDNKINIMGVNGIRVKKIEICDE